MDGVLVDSADAHLRAWQRLGEEVGVPFSKQFFQQTFGQRNASIIPSWLGDVSAARVTELEHRKESLYRQFVRQGAIRIYPGVGGLLDQLRSRGAKAAIATSGPRENATLLVEILGIGARIDAMVAAEDVSEGKPHPQVFLVAAERLGIAPACCAVIEDSVHGIEAAKRAGMLAIAVLTSTPSEKLLAAGADRCLREVGALNADWLVATLCR
jgi:beta-phosphoglucomutase